jgi:hemerythrin
MSLMQWTKEAYGTNVDVCDQQHQELFNRLNTLNDAVSGGKRMEIGDRLDSLIDFVVKHFKTEEHLMEERSFSGLADHREEHDRLVDTCADLQKKFHANEAEIKAETMVYLKDWLNHHIPVTDRSYGPALSA